MPEQLVPAEIKAALEGSSVQIITDDAAAFACQLATSLVCGHVRKTPILGVPNKLVPVAKSLAIRIAVNPAQYRRMSIDVEGTSFSATYAPALFTLAELAVLNRYRIRTA